MPKSKKKQDPVQALRDRLAKIIRNPEHDKEIATILRDRIAEMTKGKNDAETLAERLANRNRKLSGGSK
jgi:hypothetical protein